MAGNPKTKRVWLIDAVAWSVAYPATNPLRDVHRWFARWVEDLPGLDLAGVKAEADVMAAVRSGADGVIISGSPRDAWNEDPVNLKLCEVVGECRDRGIPLLGVCYGHQLLARALGGVVGRHPEGLELGNTPVRLTAAGRVSPLLAGLPERFEVLSSHVDAVLEMPPGGELLVEGDFTRNQGFHWGNQLFGVQFHPESDPGIMQFIWNPRRETWRAKVAFNLDQAIDGLRPTPQAGGLLRNFVTQIVWP